MERKQGFSGGRKQGAHQDRNRRADQNRTGGGYRDAGREQYQGGNRGGYSVGYKEDGQIGEQGKQTDGSRKPYQGVGRGGYQGAGRGGYQGKGRGGYQGAGSGGYQGGKRGDDRGGYQGGNRDDDRGDKRGSFETGSRDYKQGSNRGRFAAGSRDDNQSGNRGRFAPGNREQSNSDYRGRNTEQSRESYGSNRGRFAAGGHDGDQGGKRGKFASANREPFKSDYRTTTHPANKDIKRGFQGNNEKAEEAAKRADTQKDIIEETQDDLERLEGRNPVLEALKAGRSINRILVAKGDKEGSINQIIALAKENKIILQEVDRTKLDSLSLTQAHQGVIAFAAAKDYVTVENILERAAASGRPPFIIILDEITDAYNLGSILRTADAAGAHGVIIPKRRAVGLTSVVSKASAGAIEYVPVARVTNLVQTIELLKKNNIWVVGTDSSGEKPYFTSDLKGPVAIVIGSEGEGMGRLVRESCDFTVNIPMKGSISSLNAAIAGALVMFEILRQRSIQ